MDQAHVGGTAEDSIPGAVAPISARPLHSSRRMRSTVRTMLAIGVTCAVVLAVSAGPASSHSEFEPGEAAPGSVVELVLLVEDERADTDTVKVQLALPAEVPIIVVELPEVPGWISSVEEGTLAGERTVVTWVGGPEPDDVRLPIVLGPLPDLPGQLQFKVVQTYDNGDVERWIENWSPGAPEPEKPGPVLQLVPGAASAVPVPTTIGPSATTRTAAEPSPSTTDPASSSSNTSITSITSITSAPPTAGPPDASTLPATSTAPPGSGNGESSGGGVVFAVILALMAGAAVLIITRVRRHPG